MTTTEKRTTPYNTGFASGGVTCKLGALCFYSSAVLVDSFVLRNPPERKARKRCATYKTILDKTENFVIDYKKADFSSDYRLFYKKKYKKSLRQLLGGLTLSIIVFFLIKTFADWKIIESISVGIIVLISNFVFFKIYDILTIDKKLKKVISPIYLGKTNLIFGSTFIELNQYGRKRIIFISQLIKCIIISDIIFFIEKSNKYLPVKINKSEMTDNSFQELVKKLKVSGIKIEK